MKLARIHFISAILVLSFQIVTAQERGEPQRMMVPEGSYKWLSGNHSTEIPFREYGNHIVIPVLLNDTKKIEVTLDTGMPMPGILLYGSSEIKKMDLNITGEMPIGGAGGGAEMAKIAQGAKFKIGDIEFENQMLTIMPENPEHFSHFEDNGIIGNELFTRFAVSIDYENSILTLTEPDEYKPPHNSEEVPIYFSGNFPFIDCTATLSNGDEVPLRMVMDLGAGHALALNLGSNNKIALPKNHIKTLVGRGLHSKIFGSIGRIENFKIGSQTLDNVVVTFNDTPLMPFEKEGNLGSGIFRRFNMTIDYKNERILIAPNKFFDDPFEYNMSGLQTSKTENGNRLIETILPNSPAGKTELKEGDIIFEINGSASSKIANDEMFEILTQEGNLLKLKYLRDKKEGAVSFKLSPMI